MNGSRFWRRLVRAKQLVISTITRIIPWSESRFSSGSSSPNAPCMVYIYISYTCPPKNYSNVSTCRKKHMPYGHTWRILARVLARGRCGCLPECLTWGSDAVPGLLRANGVAEFAVLSLGSMWYMGRAKHIFSSEGGSWTAKAGVDEI